MKDSEAAMLIVTLRNAARYFAELDVQRSDGILLHEKMRQIGMDERSANAASVWIEFMFTDKELRHAITE